MVRKMVNERTAKLMTDNIWADDARSLMDLISATICLTDSQNLTCRWQQAKPTRWKHQPLTRNKQQQDDLAAPPPLPSA
jgi:hypothetical protein